MEDIEELKKQIQVNAEQILQIAEALHHISSTVVKMVGIVDKLSDENGRQQLQLDSLHMEIRNMTMNRHMQ